MQLVNYVVFIMDECIKNFTMGGFLEEKEGTFLTEGNETQRETDYRKRRLGRGEAKLSFIIVLVLHCVWMTLYGLSSVFFF